MFLQIPIQEEDRYYLRFLWKHPGAKGEPEIWCWNSLIFGAADSPLQEIKAIKTLGANCLRELGLIEFDYKVCEILDQNTYEDDLTITADSCDEAFQLYQGVKSLLARANFQVKKWASNSPELLKRLDPDSLAPTEVDLHSSEENIVSSNTTTLGVQWDPGRNLIHYLKCSEISCENNNTMVSVASLLGSVRASFSVHSTSANHCKTMTFVENEMDRHVTGTFTKGLANVGKPVAIFATGAICPTCSVKFID